MLQFATASSFIQLSNVSAVRSTCGGLSDVKPQKCWGSWCGRKTHRMKYSWVSCCICLYLQRSKNAFSQQQPLGEEEANVTEKHKQNLSSTLQYLRWGGII
jgi:hypothetical protein